MEQTRVPPVMRANYLAQRLVVWPRVRHLIGRSLGQRRSAPSPALTPEAAGWVEEIRERGYVMLGRLLTDAQIADLKTYFADKPRFDSVTGRALAPNEHSAIDEYYLNDILEAPHFLELSNNPTILAAAESYFGCRPLISQWVMRLSHPRDGAPEELQQFHRDVPDWSVLKLFIYLTDVDEDSGPHTYVEGTHRTAGSFRQHFIADEAIGRTRQTRGRVAALVGPAGTCILADTYGIHKGMVPRRAARLMLQVQYTVLPMGLYPYHPARLRRAIPDWLAADVNRLFLAPATVKG